MAISAQILALALAASPEVLDAGDLGQIIEQRATEPAAALAGRRFRISIPVVDGDRRNLRTYQSPARWRYDFASQSLDITIGLGQITAQNYDGYGPQGLGRLPPLQTAFFSTRERRAPITLRRLTPGGGDITNIGVSSVAVSHGLAVPFDGAGVSGFPPGFQPLMTYRAKLPRRALKAAVDGLQLVLEGELTSLADNPPLLCGSFRGGLQAKAVTGDTQILLRDRQCFLTARVVRATLTRGSGHAFMTWEDRPRS
ncbi:MAG: hypothetical protein JWP92_3505 [Caulobacter sp.]|nr:hypothetical protein [Caulobacter sp.]